MEYPFDLWNYIAKSIDVLHVIYSHNCICTMHKLLNLRTLKISTLYKHHILQWEGRDYVDGIWQYKVLNMKHLSFGISNLLPIHWQMCILFTEEHQERHKVQRFINNLHKGSESFMMTSSNGKIYRLTGPGAGNSPVTGEFPSQRPVTRNFDVIFDLRLE